MRRAVPVATLATLCLAGSLWSAGPAMASRSCGRSTVRGQPVSTGVETGRVSCAQARGVIAKWLSPGHAVEHGPRNGSFAEKSWTMSDGWTCKEGTGGGACSYGGTGPLRVEHARDVVFYALLP